MAKPNAVLDTRGAQASTGAMQVQVSGKHVDVGDALRERVTDEITTSIGKYFERGGDADVVVSREGHSFRVDCAVQLASGQQLRSHGLGGDAHAAFGAALTRQGLEETIRAEVDRVTATVAATLVEAAVRPQDITAVFLTGGSTAIPLARRSILALVPEARVVQGDAFGSVGLGLALDAQRKFG